MMVKLFSEDPKSVFQKICRGCYAFFFLFYSEKIDKKRKAASMPQWFSTCFMSWPKFFKSIIFVAQNLEKLPDFSGFYAVL